MMKIAYLVLFAIVYYLFVNGMLYAKSLLVAELSL